MSDAHTATRHSLGGTQVPPAVAEWDWNRLLTPRIVFMMLPVVGLLAVAYANPLRNWEGLWRTQAAWSHGYLIPLLAVVVAHFRLKERPPQRIEPCVWGLALMVAGFVLRIWSRTMMFGYPGRVTFLLVVAGIVLLVLGWDFFKTTWVSVAYLVLMIPWPVRVYERVALPLQKLAAAFAEQILSLVGFLVTRQDNVLELASGPITVAEACSGLHLLFAFVALGVLMAFMYRRPLWERVLIMASSVPIAVFCNVVRVTLMAVSSDVLHFERLSVLDGEGTWVPAWVLAGFDGLTVPEQLEAFRQTVLDPTSWLHQSFGFAMLALAFLLMWMELRIVDFFFTEVEELGHGESEAAAGQGPVEAPVDESSTA